MGLDVEYPDPPDLTNRGMPPEIEPSDALDSIADLRRGELEAALQDGAWQEAFDEWAEYTDLSEAEFEVVEEHELFAELDFFWDPDAERVRFGGPDLPALWPRDEVLTERALLELSDLGETVLDMLDDYLDWDAEGPPGDSWSEETFRDETQLE
jgi:hypothetical protein